MIQPSGSSASEQPTVSDDELVRQAQHGSREAFADLYRRHLPQVYRRMQFVIPAQDVEDVTQDTFIAVMKSLHTFRGDAQFSTWLRTVVNRQVASYYRRQERTARPTDVYLGDADRVLSSTADDRHASLDEHIMIRHGMGRLPEHYREILLLRFAEGLRFGEIARINGQSLEATKSMFRRAIAALRKQLDITNEDTQLNRVKST